MHRHSPTSAAVCSTAFYPNHGSRATTPRISLVGKAAAPGRLTTTIQEKGGRGDHYPFISRLFAPFLSFVVVAASFPTSTLVPQKPNENRRLPDPSHRSRLGWLGENSKWRLMPCRQAKGVLGENGLSPVSVHPWCCGGEKNHRISQEGLSGRKKEKPRALASSSFAQRNGDAQRYSLLPCKGQKRRFMHNTRIHIPLWVRTYTLLPLLSAMWDGGGKKVVPLTNAKASLASSKGERKGESEKTPLLLFPIHRQKTEKATFSWWIDRVPFSQFSLLFWRRAAPILREGAWGRDKNSWKTERVSFA